MIITNIGRLVTMEPGRGREGPLGVIKNAEVVVEDRKIQQICAISCHPEAKGRRISRKQLHDGYPSRPVVSQGGTQVLDAQGCVVIPGLIDCHTHLVHGGDRVNEFVMRAKGASYKEIAKAGGGIMSTVRATRAASEDELFEAAAGRAREAISHGVTMVEVKSGYGLDVETELKMLKIVRRLGKELPIDFVPTFLGAHVVPRDSRLVSSWKERGARCEVRGSYVDLIIQKMLPAVVADSLAKFCDVFVENIAFTKKEALQILNAAAGYGIRSKLHADQLTSGGGAGLAAKLSAVSADHLEHISSSNIKAMAKAGVVAVLIPSSIFFIGGKYAPARELIKADVNVAISTDYNPGTSPILNLWLAATMAITQMKMTPEEAYRGITINAARALGLEKTHGSIAVGKSADFVILDTVNEFEPFYRFDKSFVQRVVKSGRIIHKAR